MGTHNMDYVPTLCALGTVGIGVTGLALGCEEKSGLRLPGSRKRKAPGPGGPIRSFSSPLLRSTGTSDQSHMTAKEQNSEIQMNGVKIERSENTNLRPTLWRKISEGWPQTRSSTPPLSRQNSTGPRLSVLSRTDREITSTADREDLDNASKSTPWLKRISTISSFSGSASSSMTPGTPSVSVSNISAMPVPLTSSTPPILPPNKLVKRSSSQRALSAKQLHVPPLRRPATSHQRSATFDQLVPSRHEEGSSTLPRTRSSDLAAPGVREDILIWRPYFGTSRAGWDRHHDRKRHTSGAISNTSIRPVPILNFPPPTLLPVAIIEPRDFEDELADLRDYNAGDSVQADPLSGDREQSVVNNSKARNSLMNNVFGSSPPVFSSAEKTDNLRKRGKSKRFSFSSTFDRQSAPQSAGGLADGTNTTNRSKQGRYARRRNVTEPIFYQPAPTNTPSLDNVAASFKRLPSASSPLSPISNVSEFDIELPRGTPTFPPTPLSDTHSDLSSSYRMSAQLDQSVLSRRKRVSLAPSDLASTTFGSDNDTRVFTSGDEDSMDFQSDTAYDSLATRATASSHSGLRGARIETIFDESPPSEGVKDLVTLQDLMNGGSLDGLAISIRDQYLSEDAMEDIKYHEEVDFTQADNAIRPTLADDASTPSKTKHLVEDFTATPTAFKAREGQQYCASVSPPSTIKPEIFRVQTAEDIRRSIEAMSMEHKADCVGGEEFALYGNRQRTDPLPFHLRQEGRFDGQSRELTNDMHGIKVQREHELHRTTLGEQRSSIFDWSEQLRSDNLPNGSSPRPKTVHGKQAIESRGSRAPGRRGPSALHLRSQSVPVARESVLENDPALTVPKFGTWGLGHKGVSEEWNDDFEFEESEEEAEETKSPENSAKTAWATGMKVPQAIIDRQASVHGQFGQVQEFMLLVEELKRLRVQGITLQLLRGPHQKLWEEAENIVNLATLNDEEDDLHPPHSPSSLGGFDEFYDGTPPQSRPRGQSKLNQDESRGVESRSVRSISNPATPPSSRPRGESLAQARSFLQTIHQKRDGLDTSLEDAEANQHKKLFDTEDLRDLVMRANGVTRALKDVVRRAEGVSLSPEKTNRKLFDPPFSQIFDRAEQDAPPPLKKPALPKSRSTNSYPTGNETDFSGHLKMMTVV